MIRVLLVDDEALVRTGLRLILESAGDLIVVGEAHDGVQAQAAVRRDRPDVVLMDVRMPGVDGLTATAAVRAGAERPQVIVLTTFDTDDYVFRALEAGAAGFLLKDTPPRELIRAVRLVAAGDSMLSPGVTRRLIARLTGDRRAEHHRQALALVEALTGREPRNPERRTAEGGGPGGRPRSRPGSVRRRVSTVRRGGDGAGARRPAVPLGVTRPLRRDGLRAGMSDPPGWTPTRGGRDGQRRRSVAEAARAPEAGGDGAGATAARSPARRRACRRITGSCRRRYPARPAATSQFPPSTGGRGVF